MRSKINSCSLLLSVIILFALVLAGCENAPSVPAETTKVSEPAPLFETNEVIGPNIEERDTESTGRMPPELPTEVDPESISDPLPVVIIEEKIYENTTPEEEPVEVVVKDAIILLIDMSPSGKDFSFTVGGITYDRIEKGIATDILLHTIPDTTDISVYGFANDVSVISELSPLGEKREDVINAIGNLETIGNNTNFFNALKTAADIQDYAGSKELILISDGSDNVYFSQPEVPKLYATFRSKGIKIYTINTCTESGHCDLDSEYMEQIAYNTKGQSFTLDTYEDLFDILD